MRSQASKSPPKKGPLNKTFKAKPPTKQVKSKNISPKKIKNVVKKYLLGDNKKKSSNVQNDGDSGTSEKVETDPSTSAAAQIKPAPKSESLTKKPKKEPKEKKETAKTNVDSISDVRKTNTPKKNKSMSIPNIKVKKKQDDNDIIKYKLKSDVTKQVSPKLSKSKSPIKPVTTLKQKIKGKLTKPVENKATEDNDSEEEKMNKRLCLESFLSDKSNESSIAGSSTSDKTKTENSTSYKSNVSVTSSSNGSSELQKNESDRPLKFFTSTRAVRTANSKYCRTKSNTSVADRLLSLKCTDNKTEENAKLKGGSSNDLVSQGPQDIDVYTFTDKVDSPKSVLSDFRNPVNKTVGRVRPIARVKGTIIDKKSYVERKVSSPHRPIEEVVKLLKANKRTEELKIAETLNKDSDSSTDSSKVSESNEAVKPKPIVSKSYKMVARKFTLPGKPIDPDKIKEQDSSSSQTKVTKTAKNTLQSPRKNVKAKISKSNQSDDEFENCKFSLSSKSKDIHYSSSEESSDSNDDYFFKGSLESEALKNKKNKRTTKYKRSPDAKANTSKEIRELLKDGKDSSSSSDKPNKKRLKLLSMWSGPKKHRMASLNAIAKVHCLYENESRTHMELGLMKTVDKQLLNAVSKPSTSKKRDVKQALNDENEDNETDSEFEKMDRKDDSSEDYSTPPPTRSLRGEPGIRSAGKYWDPKSSTSSSEDSEMESRRIKDKVQEKKKISPKCQKTDTEKSTKAKKTPTPLKKKRNRNEVVMDLKDMVVQKRMASLNATAILAASYEKRSPKSGKDDSTSDSYSDDSFTSNSKNGASSGVKSEPKNDEPKVEETSVTDRKQKVEVVVNQDTDVTITGVYSTHHHEGFCTVSGLQYRISSTSHTQTTATANCEKESCTREEGGAHYTPLTALSSMQPPPADHAHPHTHPVAELGGLARRAAGCSSAFSAPSPSAHHEPGYYQPAGPLIKETGADAERALARYHPPPPPPHYHPPHPQVLQQYGSPYYPADLCYGRYYRPGAPYHMTSPAQPDTQMVAVGSEQYLPPPPQYYGAPPCYQHSPQRLPYIEYRGCPCPKNVLIGPATGKAPAGGGPADVPSTLALPGGTFRTKVRAACSIDSGAESHGSGKDPPPLEQEPPAAADAPHPCAPPTIGGASPKRELYDVRDNVGLAPNSSEAAGPPSPARGSAGACAPQPPQGAPRRPRLGKDMARASLADTRLLLDDPRPLPADDDVLAISPPPVAPIDLSSSDETAPLLDVKKENDGPTFEPVHKMDTPALREHNSTADSSKPVVTAKAVKRRYSKAKLDIDMREVVLKDACKTNGIGEHVKLQKRRKISTEQSDTIVKVDTTPIKESKRKCKPKAKRPKISPDVHKKCKKRKLSNADLLEAAKVTESKLSEVCRLSSPVLPDNQRQNHVAPKIKSALLLDNLLRKNSTERADADILEKEISPAELFLPVGALAKKSTLNVNNNLIDNNGKCNNSVRPNTIHAVTQLLGKKLANKYQSNVNNKTKSLKTIKRSPNNKTAPNESVSIENCSENGSALDATTRLLEESSARLSAAKLSDDSTIPRDPAGAKLIKTKKSNKLNKTAVKCKEKRLPEENNTEDIDKLAIDNNEHKKPQKRAAETTTSNQTESSIEKSSAKRCKLSVEKTNGDITEKVEKVSKLLVTKKSVIKTDEAAEFIEEACESPIALVKSPGRRVKRRRSNGKRLRRVPALLAPPTTDLKAPPRWSNGWQWYGDSYVHRVSLNNDSRLDRTARCWTRMTHASGDQIARGDCVLLRASSARAQPFVARVARLWENPDDGEMMVSLVWYYRPEHTERGRQPEDAPDEVFASRHRDANSVACIEDKCYVLTFNEYCRYRKKLKAAEEGIVVRPSIVPPMPASEVNPMVATNDSKLPPSVSAELVLFCRKIYDFRSKKIQVPNK